MDGCGRRAEQITMAANALAALLARHLTLDEQNIVGNLLTAAGATLLSIAAIGESYHGAEGEDSGGGKETAGAENTENAGSGKGGKSRADGAGGAEGR